MGQLKVEGNIIAGPPQSTNTFPAAVFTTPLFTAENPKGFQVGTGVLTRNLNSGLAYVTFPELGGAAAVTKGTFFYMRSDGVVSVRITTDDGLGGDVVAVIPLQGLLILEFPPNLFLKKIEVQGSSKLEYLVTGNQ